MLSTLEPSADWSDARPVLALAFAGLPPAEREARLADMRAEFAEKSLDCRATVRLVRGNRTIGGCPAFLQTDGTGVVWPPVGFDITPAQQSALARESIDRIARLGGTVVQAILAPGDSEQERFFRSVGLRSQIVLHWLAKQFEPPPETEPATRPIALGDPAESAAMTELFAAITSDTQDCAEFVSHTTPEQSFAAYRASGEYWPAGWRWLEVDGRRVGLLVLAKHPEGFGQWTDGPTVEVAYLGIHPHARRRGLAQKLVAEAERLAHSIGVGTLVLAVDDANSAGRKLYERTGFENLGSQVVLSRYLD